MLDVHPPHHSPNSWRGFFLHIVTIVIGLLIAIGLEQAVEYVHHQRQIREMEDALSQESRENRHVVQDDLAEIATATPIIEANMVSLERSRLDSSHTPVTLLPLPPTRIFVPIDAAWLGMRDSALISIVPHQVSTNYWKLDFMVQRSIVTTQEIMQLKDKILALEKLQTPSNLLSPTERDALLLAFSEYAQKLGRLRDTLDAFDVSLQLALQGKDLSIETTNQAQKRSDTL
jgi:hypothetical protein